MLTDWSNRPPMHTRTHTSPCIHTHANTYRYAHAQYLHVYGDTNLVIIMPHSWVLRVGLVLLFYVLSLDHLSELPVVDATTGNYHHVWIYLWSSLRKMSTLDTRDLFYSVLGYLSPPPRNVLVMHMTEISQKRRHRGSNNRYSNDTQTIALRSYI